MKNTDIRYSIFVSNARPVIASSFKLPTTGHNFTGVEIMEAFPSTWRDTPKARQRWAVMQSNELFLQKHRQPLQCHYCGKNPLRLHHWTHPCYGDDATADHVVPLVSGGSNEEHNKVVACRTCNMAKGAN
jgi:5-methylcytosine-specific restriction endonuclease McrA